MKDIDDGFVSYYHKGEASAGNDSLILTLSDGTNIGYLIRDSEFPIEEPSVLNIQVLSVTGGTPLITTNSGLSSLKEQNEKVSYFELARQ